MTNAPQPTTQTQQPSPHHMRPDHFTDEPLEAVRALLGGRYGTHQVPAHPSLRLSGAVSPLVRGACLRAGHAWGRVRFEARRSRAGGLSREGRAVGFNHHLQSAGSLDRIRWRCNARSAGAEPAERCEECRSGRHDAEDGFCGRVRVLGFRRAAGYRCSRAFRVCCHSRSLTSPVMGPHSCSLGA